MKTINPGNHKSKILFTTFTNLEDEEENEILIHVTQELLEHVTTTVFDLHGTPNFKQKENLQEFNKRTVEIALANLDLSYEDQQTFFSTGTLPDDCFFDRGECFYGTIFEDDTEIDY